MRYSLQKTPLPRPSVVAFAIAVLTANAALVRAQGVEASARNRTAGRVSWLELGDATAGSRAEDDLRLLQLLQGRADPPFSLRPLTPFQLEEILLQRSGGMHVRAPSLKRFSSRLATPQMSVMYNTRRPYSENDGPVWSGRGLTFSASAGWLAELGPLSIVLRPEAFWTENRPFDNAPTGIESFSNPYDSAFIDLPRRFGSHTYSQFSLGESWIRIGNRYVAAALSTASQVWGPARVYPLVLGNNAGGFPQLVIESGSPWRIGIGTLHLRSTVGKLARSAFAPPPGVARPAGDYRLGAGFAFLFVPRGMTNLELGAGRFFHRYWSGAFITKTTITIPFEGFLKQQVSRRPGYDQSADNQMVSLFARLALRNIEIYGELARDDHPWDLRDLVAEADHASGYVLGLRKAIGYVPDERLNVFSVEVLNARESHLKRVRDQAPFYTHTGITEGHTYRGQTLGSPAAFGGSGLAVALERRRRDVSWTYSLRSERTAQNTEGGSWYGTMRGFSGLGIERRGTSLARAVTASLLTQSYWHERNAHNVALKISVEYRVHESASVVRLP